MKRFVWIIVLIYFCILIFSVSCSKDKKSPLEPYEPTWKTYTEEDGLADNDVRAIAVDADNVKWFGTHNSGVSSFDGTEWKTYTSKDWIGYDIGYDFVLAIAVDADNVKWFGTYNGVASFDGTIWKTYTAKDGLVLNYVSSVSVDADNVKWFGTYGWGVSSLH